MRSKTTPTRSSLARRSALEQVAYARGKSSGPIADVRAPALLSERAYVDIRNKILKGELPVGMAISRRQLAEEFKISVPPVTEALQRLEAEGILESKPRVGTRVRKPTRQEIEDRCLLREALECQSARLFAERATSTEKNELARMGRRMDQLFAGCEDGPIDREYLFSVNTYHIRLHLFVAECARCVALRDAIEKEQVLIFNWLFDMAVDRDTPVADHHAALCKQLASGDPETAAAAMKHHIRFGLQEVLAKHDCLDDTDSSWRSKRRPAGG